ncbi:MAG: L-serine ammonia-lyase [Saprospiraceae bacterium]
MERLSIFDIFKIGVGPSSSHTLGPWKAAFEFAENLQNKNIDAVEINLYGSLSKTGKGHATDVAIQLGLLGFRPETIDTQQIADIIFKIRADEEIKINEQVIHFLPKQHIVFHPNAHAGHPNTLIFKAFKKENLVLATTYFSVGGGFIQEEGASLAGKTAIKLPFPIDKGVDLLAYTESENVSISDIVWQNELHFRPQKEVEENTESIFNTMLNCTFKGCQTGGILPGGLNVKRRAKALHEKLLEGKFTDAETWLTAIKESTTDFNIINKWISCFALAVNEENAALGRVVTSPTNGAAGVIPAVLLYFLCFCENKGMVDIQRFLFTAGEIGCLFKKGATISAAVGGCQAEIGVSSAMAAGGLTEVLGGSPQQVLMAAEIAMEHHLGLTCDPIGGLVQIPCIERNAMGAMKAITASNLALCGNPENSVVKFDTVVKTMWDTAQDMNEKYKETSEGGLAFNLPVILPEC